MTVSRAMPSGVPLAFASEVTPSGEQTLVPGVRPVPLRARLEARMAAPLLPLRAQKPMDLGLFDLAARDQLDLFGISGRAPSPVPELPPSGG